MKLSSLNKSLEVLDLLSENPKGLNLSELSAKLGYPQSTIHHILSTFLPYDYVAQDPDSKKYSLGFKFLAVSKTILDNLDVRKAAYNHLRFVSEESGEAAHLAILRNGKAVYIDKVEKPDGLTLVTHIGFSPNPHATAVGKVLLSELPIPEIMKIYRKGRLTAYTKKTITNLDKLIMELEKIKKQGWAIDTGEYTVGVNCVAAPIRVGGRIVAAISITGSTFSMTMERINNKLKDLVIKTAEKISSEIRL